jgi:hypothetical protein
VQTTIRYVALNGEENIILNPSRFALLSNRYKGYDDYSFIPNLLPLQNYGIEVDYEKWLDELKRNTKLRN